MFIFQALAQNLREVVPKKKEADFTNPIVVDKNKMQLELMKIEGIIENGSLQGNKIFKDMLPYFKDFKNKFENPEKHYREDPPVKYGKNNTVVIDLYYILGNYSSMDRNTQNLMQQLIQGAACTSRK